MQRIVFNKLFGIFVVAVLVLIPISMVKFKVQERQEFLNEARRSVAQSWTGEQTVVTPFLVIPYVVEEVSGAGFVGLDGRPTVSSSEKTLYEVVLAHSLTGTAEIKNKSVYKGIYELAVYDSSITFSGQFRKERIAAKVSAMERARNFSRMGAPFVVVHMSDVRGIDSPPEFKIGSHALDVFPSAKLKKLEEGVHIPIQASLLKDDVSFSYSMSLRGMQRLNFVPLASSVDIHFSSNWPHPQFVGASLPKHRSISSGGFSATWVSTRYSNGALEYAKRCVKEGHCDSLLNAYSGVDFIQPVDVYLQSERSIKYAILFVGIIFISFFVFEHLTGQKIHPIQYSFVGLAIAVFYLLLISLAEHIAFGWAYFIGASCCAMLLLFYVQYLLHSRKRAVVFCGVLLALYGLLYIIIQAEDFALLMGALLVFCVLSGLMISTRNVDWYRSSLETKRTSSARQAELELQ